MGAMRRSHNLPTILLAAAPLAAALLVPRAAVATVVSPDPALPAVATPGDAIDVVLQAGADLEGLYGWLERDGFPFPLTVTESAYDAGLGGWRLTMTVPASITPGFSYPSTLDADFDDNNHDQYLYSADEGTYDLHVSWTGAPASEVAAASVMIVPPGMGADWAIVRPTSLTPGLVKRGETFDALVDAPQQNGALTALLKTRWSTRSVEIVRADYETAALPEDCASGPGGAAGWSLTLRVPADLPQDLYDLEISVAGGTYVSPRSVRVVREWRDPYVVVFAPKPMLLGEGDTGLSFAPGDALRSFEAYDADLVIVPGGLSRSRDPQEYLYVQKLAGLVRRPVFASPGASDFYDTLTYGPGEVDDASQRAALEAGWCRYGSRLPYYSFQYGNDVWYMMAEAELTEPSQESWLEERLSLDTTVGIRGVAFGGCDAAGALSYLCETTWLAAHDVDYLAYASSTGGVTTDAAAGVTKIKSQGWSDGHAYALQIAADGTLVERELITSSPPVAAYWAQDNDGLRDENTYTVANDGSMDLLRREIVFDLMGGRYACEGDGAPEIVELADSDDGEVTRLYVQFDAPAQAVASVTCTRTGDVPHENIAPVADAGGDRVLTDDDHDGVETVVFSGALSTDEDGRIVAWDWLVDGVAHEGENVSTVLDVGEHVATLTVTDDGGATATADVTISINAGQAPPIIDEEGCGSSCATAPAAPSSAGPLTALAALALAAARRRRSA